MEQDKGSYLKKNLVIFTIATVATKLITFFMLPLYTSYISTSEYGIISYITTLADLLYPLATLCITNGLLRFLFDDNYTKKEVFSSAFCIHFVGGCIYGLFAIGGIFIVPDMPQYLLFFFFYGVVGGIESLLGYFYRGIGKTHVMMETSIIRAFVSCVMAVILVAIFQMKMAGYFYSIFIGCIVTIIYGSWRIKVWKYFTIRRNKILIKKLIQFSAPMVFTSVGWWISSFIDRFVVTNFLGTSQNGIYSLAYRIPTIITILSGIMLNAWVLSAIKDFDADDNDGFISKIYRSYNFALCIGSCLIILLNIPLAKIFYVKDFFVAWKYTGFLVVSALFVALSNFYDGIFQRVKDTKSTAYASIIAAGINTVLSILLVRILGITGVALGTLISHFVVWMVKLLMCRKHIKIYSNYVKDFVIYLCLCLQFVLGLNGLNSLFIIISLVLLSAIIILYRNECMIIIMSFLSSVKRLIRRIK